MTDTLHAISNALSVAGPAIWAFCVIVWAFYAIRARRNHKAARREYATARRMLTACNAEMLQCQMLRLHHERQASTCNSTVYHGTEAPV